MNFPYKHIIWDWNGTLFNDVELSVSVINEVLGRRRMPRVSVARYLEIFGFPVIDYYRRLGFDFKEESFEVIGTEFIRGYEARKYEAEIFQQVPDVLQALTDRGASHSILSAYKQETLDELVGHFSLTPHFLKIVGLDNHYAHSKVENGLKWMAELPFEPSEVLFVGDTQHDYEVARALGVDCVLVSSGHQRKAALKETGSPVVDGIEDVLVKIENLKLKI